MRPVIQPVPVNRFELVDDERFPGMDGNVGGTEETFTEAGIAQGDRRQDQAGQRIHGRDVAVLDTGPLLGRLLILCYSPAD